MKKRTKIFLIIICILTVAIVIGAVYVASRLPDELNLTEFAAGVIGVELKKEPFVEVDTNTFFFKDGNLETVQQLLEEQSVNFVEQFGSALIFEVEGQRTQATLQSVTRWHNLLVLDVEPTE